MALPGEEPVLQTLHVHGNALTALSQLAPLAGLRQLTQLRFGDDPAGNSYVHGDLQASIGCKTQTAAQIAGGGLCGSSAARLAVAAALPQVQLLDGVLQPSEARRARPQLAALQLAALSKVH